MATSTMLAIFLATEGLVKEGEIPGAEPATTQTTVFALADRVRTYGDFVGFFDDISKRADVDPLRTIFESLDLNGDARLSAEEMMAWEMEGVEAPSNGINNLNLKETGALAADAVRHDGHPETDFVAKEDASEWLLTSIWESFLECLDANDDGEIGADEWLAADLLTASTSETDDVASRLVDAEDVDSDTCGCDAGTEVVGGSLRSVLNPKNADAAAAEASAVRDKVVSTAVTLRRRRMTGEGYFFEIAGLSVGVLGLIVSIAGLFVG